MFASLATLTRSQQVITKIKWMESSFWEFFWGVLFGRVVFSFFSGLVFKTKGEEQTSQ